MFLIDATSILASGAAAGAVAPVRGRKLAKGGKQMHEAPAMPRPVTPPRRIPRVSRWMVLALRFEQLLREGHIASYAELARLGHVTHARISQIMNPLFLAPDIQESLLFLPRTQRGRDPIILRDLQPIAAQLDWREQRRLWAKLYQVTQG